MARAYVDEEWSTIGSSNLDPLSLSLNLEANVIVRDRGFTIEAGELTPKLTLRRKTIEEHFAAEIAAMYAR